jgi:hypothetical protein
MALQSSKFLLPLLFLSSLTPVFAAKPPNLDYFKGCGLEGKVSLECGKALNRLKNRYRSPTAADINSSITLESILKDGDDLTRWSTSDAGQITGFVALVEPGGYRESCNCKSKKLQDIHINVVLTPKDEGDEEHYFVVEITPRLRYLNPDWSYKEIYDLQGKWVKFTGWMLFDTMHSLESHNTKNRPQQECGSLEANDIWRATGWEIHPVTAFEIVSAPQ